MWQQKQNNFLNLNELANLPGETTADKTALWQRLESRLQNKSQKKKVVWYWAAACLLICTSALFLFNGTRNSEAIAVNNNSGIVKPILQLKKVVAVENIQIKTTELKLPLVVNDVSSYSKKIHVTKTKQDSFISTTTQGLEDIAQNYSPVNIDTATISTVITAKKKISVVHINELLEEDRMAEQNINLAKSFKKKRTKIADKFEYAGTLNFRIYFKN